MQPRAAVLTLLLVAGGSSAWAAEEKFELSKKKTITGEAKKAKVKGWDGRMTVGGSFSLANNHRMIGQTDGTALTLGVQLDGGLDYIRDVHELRNTLKVNELFSLTPAVDQLVKTSDVLDFQSIYLYHLRRLPWFGPFGRVQLKTQVFDGYDIRGDNVTYAITRPDGTTRSVTADRLRLSDPFAPLTLKEEAGAFAQLVERDPAKLETRLGFIARQTFADDQRAVNDDGDTDAIEIQQLQDVFQAGPGLSIDFRGEMMEKRVTYFATATVMIPVVNSAGSSDDRNALELTNLLLEAGLSVKLFTWLSADYKLRIIRDPQLLDAVQIQNNLLLSVSYTLAERAEPSAEQAKAK